MSNLGIALNSNSCVTANQSRVSVGIHTLTGSEYPTFYDRCTCYLTLSGLKSYGNLRVPFYTANLTAAVYRALNGSVTHVYLGSLTGSVVDAVILIFNTHHSFLAFE